MAASEASAKAGARHDGTDQITGPNGASNINLQKQIAKGVFPSIKLRDAPATAAPAKKAVAPAVYSPFEVAATTKVSSKKASRVAAVEEVVQPIAATTSARQRGATKDAKHFFSSRHQNHSPNHANTRLQWRKRAARHP